MLSFVGGRVAVVMVVPVQRRSCSPSTKGAAWVWGSRDMERVVRRRRVVVVAEGYMVESGEREGVLLSWDGIGWR